MAIYSPIYRFCPKECVQSTRRFLIVTSASCHDLISNCPLWWGGICSYYDHDMVIIIICSTSKRHHIINISPMKITMFFLYWKLQPQNWNNASCNCNVYNAMPHFKRPPQERRLDGQKCWVMLSRYLESWRLDKPGVPYIYIYIIFYYIYYYIILYYIYIILYYIYIILYLYLYYIILYLYYIQLNHIKLYHIT